jgi:hypothetical protein
LSILSHLKGAVSGFAKGGISGGIGGLLAGKNTDTAAQLAKRAAKGQTANLSNVGVPNLGTVNQYSANPLVRYASTTQLVPLPQSLPVGPGAGMGGGGATGTWSVPTSSGVPMWAYRRLYTKKGTPRRTRRDGMPYAVPRMNPMNPRAARRAIRRVRGARKLLQRIERSLPKAHTRRTTTRRAA